MSEQRDKVIQEWMTAKTNADAWTKRERELRDYIVKAAFGYDRVAGNIEGTKYLELGNGYKLKATFVTKLEVNIGPALDATLRYIKDQPETLAKPLIIWKPVLSVTAYRQVGDEIRKMIAPCVTGKPQAPQVSVEGLE